MPDQPEPVIVAEYERSEPLALLSALLWKFLRDCGFTQQGSVPAMMLHSAGVAVSYLSQPNGKHYVFADVRDPQPWGVITLAPAVGGLTHVTLTRTSAEVRYGELLDHYWTTFERALAALDVAAVPVNAA